MHLRKAPKTTQFDSDKIVFLHQFGDSQRAIYQESCFVWLLFTYVSFCFLWCGSGTSCWVCGGAA